MSARCPDCLSVKCRYHTTTPTGRFRALHAGSGRFWLQKWKQAEGRLKKAKAALRSARATVRNRCRWGLTVTKRQDATLFAATEEARLAQADVEKKKDSFASCMRWMLEGR